MSRQVSGYLPSRTCDDWDESTSLSERERAAGFVTFCGFPVVPFENVDLLRAALSSQAAEEERQLLEASRSGTASLLWHWMARAQPASGNLRRFERAASRIGAGEYILPAVVANALITLPDSYEFAVKSEDDLRIIRTMMTVQAVNDLFMIVQAIAGAAAGIAARVRQQRGLGGMTTTGHLLGPGQLAPPSKGAPAARLPPDVPYFVIEGSPEVILESMGVVLHQGGSTAKGRALASVYVDVPGYRGPPIMRSRSGRSVPRSEPNQPHAAAPRSHERRRLGVFRVADQENLRHWEAEGRVFEELLENLPPDAKGDVYIRVSHEMCPNCLSQAHALSKQFPNIRWHFYFPVEPAPQLPVEPPSR